MGSLQALVGGMGRALRVGVLLWAALVAAGMSASAQNIIYSLAGNGTAGFSGDGGAATAASLNYPAGVTLDAAGNLYIADMFNHCIRKVAPGGTITTVAGGGLPGFLGDGQPATLAHLSSPTGVAVDAAGNIYIADRGSHRIRKIDTSGIITTIVGGGPAGLCGTAPWPCGRFSGDGGWATQAILYYPSAIVIDPLGNLFIADNDNQRIRVVYPNGKIFTYAGWGSDVGGFSGDGGLAAKAQLSLQTDCFSGTQLDCQGPGIALDAAGNLYIADRGNGRIREVTRKDGIIKTVAGIGPGPNSGDGGPATSAGIDRPTGVAVDPAGNIYIALAYSNAIRKIDTRGIISTVSYKAPLGADPTLSLDRPYSLLAEAEDNLLVADKANSMVRRIQAIAQLNARPPALNFDAIVNQGNPPPQTLDIATAANGNADWTAQLFPPQASAWLSMSPMAATAPTTAAVSINTAQLTAGGYDATIILANPVDAASTRSVPVHLGVTLPPTIALSASALSFSAVAGGASPPNQTLSIANTGAGTMPWTATASSYGGWLRVSPGSGTGPADLTVSVNAAAAGPAVGSSTGTIQVAVPHATNTPQSVTVTLTVTATPVPVISLSLSGTACPATGCSLQFSAVAGANPDTAAVDIKNTGTGTLTWKAAASTTSGGNWLVVSPTEGTAPSTLTVSVNSSALAAGIYKGAATITAGPPGQTASNSPQSIAVTLALGVPTVGVGGTVNGASFAANTAVAPGSIVSLFGINFSSDTASVSALPMPTTLAGTQVLVLGQGGQETPAPLFYVSPQQINFQLPIGELAGFSATQIVVASGAGKNRGLPANVRIATEYPGIFFVAGVTQGAVLNQDSTPNSADNPAAAGSVIQIFATGLGATLLPLKTGQPGASSPPFHETSVKPVVLVGGKATDVLFYAVAPTYVGLNQVNARVPPFTAPGDQVPLQILVNGRPSNTVTIAVK
jgi:uncharacterized protein (TIGR03437 family)